MKKCLNPRIVKRKDGKVCRVPCGKCLNCMINDQNNWVFRLKLEQEVFYPSIFITLTYDDEHLVNLNVRDCQLFIKRLRKRFNNVPLRFFYVGEYGKTTNRQHYHMAIFGLPIENLHEGLTIVEECWQKGFCYVKWLNDENIHYVTKYLTKLDPRYHDVPPFVECPCDLLLEFLILKNIKMFVSFFIQGLQVTKLFSSFGVDLLIRYLDISKINSSPNRFCCLIENILNILLLLLKNGTEIKRN